MTKIEINRVMGFEFYPNYIDVLKKFNLEIREEPRNNYIFYRYFIFVNSLGYLFEIIKQINEPLILNEDGTITIYDDYIE